MKETKAIKDFMGTPIDITAYNSTFKPGCKEFEQYNNATFLKFAWEFVGDLDPEASELDNEGVKVDQNSDGGVDELAYDYKVNGWSTSYFPPIKTTDGNYDDGRSRILAALKVKQDWIPVALFIFDSETPVADSVANSLKANLHKRARRSVMDDFVVGGIKVVESKEVKRDFAAIMNWLENKASVSQRFDNDSGVWTKIVNAILERTSREKELVRIKERDEWLTWVDGMNGIKGKHILLYKAGSGTAASRYWTDHVLPSEGNPQSTILYTNSYSPAKCSEDVRQFIEKLETYHRQSYGYVNNAITTQTELFSMRTPTDLPFNFLGVIPNLKKNGQPINYDNHMLSDIQDYIDDGSAIANAVSKLQRVA